MHVILNFVARIWLLGLSLGLVFVLACSPKKIPLQEHYGQFKHVYAHWFENEQTAYLFFELHESASLLQTPVFELSYREQVLPVGSRDHDYALVDFNSGVHQHAVVACGKDKLCASLSWKQSTRLEEIYLRFRYDSQSPLQIETKAAIFNHEISTEGTFSYSAIPYGVFDAQNKHMQMRIHHNFGQPSDAWIKASGMKKLFSYSRAQLVNQENQLEDSQALIAKQSFAFPADFCPSLNPSATVLASRDEWWLPDEWSTEDNNALGVCLQVDFLDKAQNFLLSQKAYGMRNPVVSRDDFSFSTPLQEVRQIPVLIQACQDVSGSEGLLAGDFLVYQKYVLGISREQDVCYRIHDIKDFKQRLLTHLSQRLATEKSQAGQQDFMFVIIFNERLSKEFFDVHGAIAEVSTQLASAERSLVSPRLLGAFVYASTAQYVPTPEQRKYVLWCPQSVNEINRDPLNPDMTKANCTALAPPKLKILGVNFILPMGPLPDLETYEEYVKRYGDKGLAKDPSLKLLSVLSGPNTQIEQEQQVSYLDAQRFTISENESVKVCYQREGAGAILSHLRFQPQSYINEGLPGLRADEIESLWSSDEAKGEYRIGVQWEYPFVGGIQYKSDIQVGVGPITSPIPFVDTVKNYEEVGDDKWNRQQWPVGEFLWRCQKYCDHPFFDGGGVYQLTQQWRKASFSGNCPELNTPVWNGGDR